MGHLCSSFLIFLLLISLSRCCSDFDGCSDECRSCVEKNDPSCEEIFGTRCLFLAFQSCSSFCEGLGKLSRRIIGSGSISVSPSGGSDGAPSSGVADSGDDGGVDPVSSDGDTGSGGSVPSTSGLDLGSTGIAPGTTMRSDASTDSAISTSSSTGYSSTSFISSSSPSSSSSTNVRSTGSTTSSSTTSNTDSVGTSSSSSTNNRSTSGQKFTTTIGLVNRATTDAVTSASLPNEVPPVNIQSTSSTGSYSNNASSKNSNNLLAIVIPVAGGGLLVAFIIGALVFYKRRRSTQKKDGSSDSQEMTDRYAQVTLGENQDAKAYTLESGSIENYDNVVSSTAHKYATVNENFVTAENYENLGAIKEDRANDVDIAITKLNNKMLDLFIDYSEIELKGELGHGAFGIVYHGTWRGSDVAVKQMTKAKLTESEVKEFERELAVMRNLRPHRNVIALFGYCARPMCIVTEFCANGSLYSSLRTNPPNRAQQLRIINGIVAGMIHLHYEKIIHRDLAARNILVHQNDVKVADFGMSRLSENAGESNQTNSVVGPLKWMSPESLKERIYSDKTDVYSFGCLLVEILTGKEPYDDMAVVQVAIQVANGAISPLSCLKPPSKYPQEIVELIKDCVQADPNKRPSFINIMKRLPSS